MRITVTEIRSTRPLSIGFNSVAGAARGIWRGEAPPRIGDYDVELEIPAKLRWGDDLQISDAIPSGISEIDGQYQFVGRVIESEAEGVMSIDIAGSVVLVETIDSPPRGIVGATVSARVPKIEIYPSAL